MKKYLFLALANIFLISNLSYAKNTRHGTGLSFDDNKYNKTLLSAPLLRGQYDNIPTSNSLIKYAPKAGNQGDFGTCVGWSTTYAARTILYNMNKGNTFTEELNTHSAFSPSYVYNQLSTDTTCQLGTFLDDALGILTNQGATQLWDFGYECNKPVTVVDKMLAASYKIDGYKKLFDIDNTDKINPVRKSLSENKPVVIGMKCCSESFGNSYGADVWTTNPNEPEPAKGHAMAIIGYDDNKYNGAFLIMNSWGEEWGNKGFIWVRYADFSKYTKYAYEMIETEKGESISGNLEFKTINGQKMPIKLNNSVYEVSKPYSSGTLFRLYVTNNEPAYIYAIGSDLTNQTYKIFPHKDNISPYLGYKNSEFALPDEDHYIRMDNTTGTDYFCFLYSKDAINIEELRQKIQAEDGSFIEKVNKALVGKIIDSKDIKYSNDKKISFSAQAKKEKNILPVIVKMEHN